MFWGHYVFLAEIGLERRKVSHGSKNQITTGAGPIYLGPGMAGPGRAHALPPRVTRWIYQVLMPKPMAILRHMCRS